MFQWYVQCSSFLRNGFWLFLFSFSGLSSQLKWSSEKSQFPASCCQKAQNTQKKTFTWCALQKQTINKMHAHINLYILSCFIFCGRFCNSETEAQVHYIIHTVLFLGIETWKKLQTFDIVRELTNLIKPLFVPFVPVSQIHHANRVFIFWIKFGWPWLEYKWNFLNSRLFTVRLV